MNDPLTRRLLTAGMLAGPIVMTVGGLLALTREGFELERHGSSMLALGEHGWMQAVNFFVAGLLTSALVLGVGRAQRGQAGSRWVFGLLSVFALMHILVAVFPTDPAFGFPPGPNTPIGAPAPADASIHAIVHSLAGFAGFNALAVACFVIAWQFGRRAIGWCLLSLVTGASIIGIDLYAMQWETVNAGPSRATASFNFLPMWLLLPLIWGYLTVLAWHFRQQLADKT